MRRANRTMSFSTLVALALGHAEALRPREAAFADLVPGVVRAVDVETFAIIERSWGA
jgi:hypothetical protein